MTILYFAHKFTTQTCQNRIKATPPWIHPTGSTRSFSICKSNLSVCSVHWYPEAKLNRLQPKIEPQVTHFKWNLNQHIKSADLEGWEAKVYTAWFYWASDQHQEQIPMEWKLRAGFLILLLLTYILLGHQTTCEPLCPSHLPKPVKGIKRHFMFTVLPTPTNWCVQERVRCNSLG